MKDQLEGQADETIGGVKKAAGEATNDPNLQAEGIAQQAAGGAKKLLGDAKDKINGAVADIKEHFDDKQ